MIGERNDNSSLVEPGRDSHHIASPSPFLPAEMLALILRWHRYGDRDAWREMANIMLNCCLVSKAWYEAARAVLFQDIRLSEVESLRLLLRTVRESFGGHCPAHALHPSYPFANLGRQEQVKEYIALTAELVACSPELRHLEAHNGTLNFSSDISLPEYPHLKKVKVSSQHLHLIAPLLHRACNLKSFEVRRGPSGNKLLEHCPPPSFNLSAISISQTELSASECNWLFASSCETIEFLEVEDVGVSLGHLAKVIGGFVKNLYIKRAIMDFDFIGSRGVKTITLSGFTSLRRLRVEEWDSRWVLVDDDLPSSLETFAISFSMEAITNVVKLLCSNWQPSLQSLDVYETPLDFSKPLDVYEFKTPLDVHQRPMGVYETPSESLLDSLQFSHSMDYWQRDELQRACAGRGIQLNWLTIPQ